MRATTYWAVVSICILVGAAFVVLAVGAYAAGQDANDQQNRIRAVSTSRINALTTQLQEIQDRNTELERQNAVCK